MASSMNLHRLVRRVLTGFELIVILGWGASLAIFSVDQTLAAAKFDDWRPVGVGLIVVVIQLACAGLIGRKIRRSRDMTASGWTLVAVLGALILVPFNVYAGVVNAVG